MPPILGHLRKLLQQRVETLEKMHVTKENKKNDDMEEQEDDIDIKLDENNP